MPPGVYLKICSKINHLVNCMYIHLESTGIWGTPTHLRVFLESAMLFFWAIGHLSHFWTQADQNNPHWHDRTVSIRPNWYQRTRFGKRVRTASRHRLLRTFDRRDALETICQRSVETSSRFGCKPKRHSLTVRPQFISK